MKTVAIVQARMSSSRLPGKIMAEIEGKAMLWHVVTRARAARCLDTVAVATSVAADDDHVEAFCRANDFPCFRGSLDDVLDRYLQAARHFGADIVVRVTADCPMLDPALIEPVVEAVSRGGYDYAANNIDCTYPDGLDAEAFRYDVLERAWREARLTSEREHVTPYIRKHPELFNIQSIKGEKDLSALRWTVDEPRDLEFVQRVFAGLGKTAFGMNDVVDLIARHPELQDINQDIGRNEGYLKSLMNDSIIQKERENE